MRGFCQNLSEGGTSFLAIKKSNRTHIQKSSTVIPKKYPHQICNSDRAAMSKFAPKVAKQTQKPDYLLIGNQILNYYMTITITYLLPN